MVHIGIAAVARVASAQRRHGVVGGLGRGVVRAWPPAAPSVATERGVLGDEGGRGGGHVHGGPGQAAGAVRRFVVGQGGGGGGGERGRQLVLRGHGRGRRHAVAVVPEAAAGQRQGQGARRVAAAPAQLPPVTRQLPGQGAGDGGGGGGGGGGSEGGGDGGDDDAGDGEGRWVVLEHLGAGRCEQGAAHVLVHGGVPLSAALAAHAAALAAAAAVVVAGVGAGGRAGRVAGADDGLATLVQAAEEAGSGHGVGGRRGRGGGLRPYPLYGGFLCGVGREAVAEGAVANPGQRGVQSCGRRRV